MAHLLDRCVIVNTLRPEQNGCHFADDIFRSIFWSEICGILIDIMSWQWLGGKPLPEPMITGALRRHVLEQLTYGYGRVSTKAQPCMFLISTCLEVTGEFLAKMASNSEYPLNNAPYIMHSQEQFNPVHIIITYSMLPSIFFLPVQSVSEVLTSLMYLVHHCLPNVIAIFHSDSSNLRSLIWQSDCFSPLRPWQNGQYFTEHILKCNIINEKFVFWFIFHWNLLI